MEYGNPTPERPRMQEARYVERMLITRSGDWHHTADIAAPLHHTKTEEMQLLDYMRDKGVYAI
jgi:hypothetical protein